MSKRGGSSRLELRLNLPPNPPESPEFSSEGSCVSSDQAEENVELQQRHNMNQLDEHANKGRQEIRAMLLVGCPQCLMYVMLSKVDASPKCPKCKNTVLLEFLNEQNSKKPNTP